MSAPGLLVTRPEPGASELARFAAGLGFRPILSPVLEAVELPAEVEARGLAGVTLTSAAGARAAPAGGALRALPCWCVGEATAAAARAAGFRDVRAGAADAEALARLILSESEAGARVAHLRGRHGTDRLAEALAGGGVRLEAVEVYEMRAARALSAEAEAALAAREVTAAPVYSPRSGRVLARLMGGRFDLSGAAALAISPAAAEALRGAGFGRVEVASAPTGAAMRALLRAEAPAG